ncbi:hypothetical protein HPULCUR_007781 [Helicostylum pulchrum]|uniref:C2H2-type domain-containing protein n=1 Tax=Helicostylum pulchrum TaxID=562976 RepID=A0ABP9Y5R8_9FUNG
MTTVIIACPFCVGNAFSDRARLRHHLKKKHSLDLPSLRPGRPGRLDRPDRPVTEICVTSDGIEYACPSCALVFQATEQLRLHLESHTIKEHETSNVYESNVSESDVFESNVSESNVSVSNQSSTSEEEGEEEEVVVTLSPSVTMPPSSSHIDAEEINTRRTYENAVLHACQQTGDNVKEKSKTMYILDNMNLQPFSMLNNDTEHNGLAHPDVIAKCTSKSCIIEPITSKRSYGEMDSENICSGCSINNPSTLQHLLIMSPYVKLLRKRKYVELNPELCDLLNYDWNFYPHMKYFAVQLLAGGIMINTKNNTSIMINTLEVYGRKKGTNIHREAFGTKKKIAITTTLPPPYKTKYPDVWPMTLTGKDGPGLMIGTQSCNVVVTSSIRLDHTTKPTLGGVTTNFQLTESDSLSTVLYLDEESVEKANNLAKNINAASTSNCNIINQIRQLNTKFDSASSYYLCRASGPITKSHQYFPYSIYTLYDFDRGRNPASKLFSKIALSVLKEGNKAYLDKSLVNECVSNTTGRAKSLLLGAYNVYKDGEEQIKIIGNRELNEQLEKLSSWLHPYIITANESAEASIINSFNHFKD